MSIVTSVKPEQNQLPITPSQMMDTAEHFALTKTSKPTGMTLALATMAGIFIGLAFVFYLTVTTGNNDLGYGLNKLIGGLAFSLGLILVVLCGGELFTSTVMSLISWVRKEVTTQRLLASWSKVYLGNFIGAMFLVALVFGAKMYLNGGGQWGVNALNVAQHKLHHTPLQAFSLGVLCNLMVCLAVWLTFSTRSNGAKAMLMTLPVALFVSSGFEHCIANLFMVPLGIAIVTHADPAFWAQAGVQASAYADLTWGHFLINNLIPVTLGNIVGGGVLVGLGNYVSFRSLAPTPVIATEVQARPRTVIDVMNNNPLLLSKEILANEALQQLAQAGQEGAPVVNDKQQLIGFISHHEILVNLCCQDGEAVEMPQLSDLMQRQPATAAATDKVVDLVQRFIKEVELPVSASGIAVTLSGTSNRTIEPTEINQTDILPVIDAGKVVGTISRTQITAELHQSLLLTPAEQPLAKTA